MKGAASVNEGSTTSTAPGSSPGRAARVIVLAIAACYANSLAVPFLFDDPLPEQPLSFATRPLVAASFALNRALGGSSVWGYHVFNLLVHAGCALLLLGVVRRSAAAAAPQLATRTRDGLALAAALLWACHPLQTESVTYVSQRAEAMGSFFVLAVVYGFLRSTAAERPRAWQVLSLTALALGFATKEIAAVAPLLLWLLDAVLLGNGFLGALRLRRGYYAALVAAELALAALFLFPVLFAEHASAGFEFRAFGALDYARSQPGVVLHYLRLALWPHPLVFDYGWRIAARWWEIAPQAALLGGLALAAVALLARRSWMGVALAWFFVLLAPTSSVVPIKDLAFEHRMYLPLAGVVVLAVAAGRALCARFAPATPALPRGLALAALVALGALTVRRNGEYRSALVLWQTVVERAPGNPRGHSNLATALKEAGLHDQALAALQTAVELDPQYFQAHHKLGNSYLLSGDFARAAAAFERALALSETAEAHRGLGLALLRQERAAEALGHFQRALELAPADAEVHCGLAHALVRLERADEAAAHYEEAARLDPSLEDAHINLAALYLARGEPGKALAAEQRALAIPPDTAEEYFNLGQCLLQLGRGEEALKAFRAARRRDPDQPEACSAIARLLCAQSGAGAAELDEALELAQRADELTRNARADVLETLALVHAARGEREQAAAALERALALPGPARNAAFAARLRAKLDEMRGRDAPVGR